RTVRTTMQTLLALATARPDPPRLAGPLQPVLTGLLRRNPRARISAADAERLLSSVADGRPRPRRLLRSRAAKDAARAPVEPAVAREVDVEVVGDEPDTPVLTDTGRYETARLPASETGAAPGGAPGTAAGDVPGAPAGDVPGAPAGLPVRSPGSTAGIAPVDGPA